MKAYGGTYNDYLDTPEFAREMLLHLDDVYEHVRQNPPTPPSTGQGVPMIT